MVVRPPVCSWRLTTVKSCSQRATSTASRAAFKSFSPALVIGANPLGAVAVYAEAGFNALHFSFNVIHYAHQPVAPVLDCPK